MPYKPASLWRFKTWTPLQVCLAGIAAAVAILFCLGLAGFSGCGGIREKSPSSEVKSFFMAGNEANFQGLQCLSPGAADLSAYAQLAGVRYPPTAKVEVLREPPSRPYKAFAVLECNAAPNSKPEELGERFKPRAREIGADAIILCRAGDQGLTGRLAPGKIQAVAIIYKKFTGKPD